jgi:hypothetical protein
MTADQWQANFLPMSLATPADSSPTLPQAQEVKPVAELSPTGLPWDLKFKDDLQHGKAVIYALNVRTFGAHDDNNDGLITPAAGESGSFLSAIARLPELKAQGFNTIHLLPILPIGRSPRLGEAGSLYAPSSYTALNPEFDELANGVDELTEAQTFVKAAHANGLTVMVDVPSCASHDLAKAHPDLIAYDEDGNTLTPINWVDVVMMDKDSPELREYMGQFFDLMANKVGVDGFRCDIARARTPEFWQHFTNQYPNKGWFAESYVEEDDSPLQNLPRDYPGDLMRSGFDSVYGQFHIFHGWTAPQYTDYVKDQWGVMKGMASPKAFTGTFYTHDDPSLMTNGGVPMMNICSAMMALQPFTNAYVMDGYMSGDEHRYDIFDYKPPTVGNHPEVGEFFTAMQGIRNADPAAAVDGSCTLLPVKADKPNHHVIAFTRNAADGHGLMVLANNDVNHEAKASITVAGLLPDQPLPADLVDHVRFANSGEASKLAVIAPNKLDVTLAPGAIHIFPLANTKVIADSLPTLYPWGAEAKPPSAVTG